MTYPEAAFRRPVENILECCARVPFAGRCLRSFVGTLMLIRFLNLIGIGTIALASALWAGSDFWPADDVVLFVLGYVFIAAGGYAINDLMDVEADLIAHPSRALVLRLLSPSSAWLVTAISFAAGVLIHIQLGAIFWMLSPSLVFALTIYSLYLKARFGLLGNLLIAFIVASVPIGAALRSGAFDGLLIISCIGFGTCLAREVLKDIEDKPGDLVAGRKTLATLSLDSLSRFIVFGGVLLACGASVYLVVTLPSIYSLPKIAIIINSGILLLGLLRWMVKPTTLSVFQVMIWASMFVYAVTFLSHALEL